MAKGKQSSPSKKKRYAAQPAVTQRNKMRHIEQEKKRVEKNSKKVRVKNESKTKRTELPLSYEVGTVTVSDGHAIIATSGYVANKPRVIHL